MQAVKALVMPAAVDNDLAVCGKTWKFVDLSGLEGVFRS
jgi:hypothetical protein